MSHKQQSSRRRRKHSQGPSQPSAAIDPYQTWMIQEPFAVHLKLLSLYEAGGIRRRDIIRSYIAMEDVGESADRFLGRRTSSGEDAAIFNRMTRAIAVLSYLPGGVPFRERIYQAEAFFAGIFGEQGARDHVQSALRHCFGAGPVSAEPLLALSRHVLSCQDRGPLRTVLPLTEDEASPTVDQWASALIAYLAVGPFLSYWRHRTSRVWSEQEVYTTAAETLAGARKLGPNGDRSNGEESDEGELAQIAAVLGRRDEMLSRWIAVSRQLKMVGERQPERLNTLLGFALSHDKMERSIFQHLLLLLVIKGEPEDLEIPDRQTYRDLLFILTQIVEALSDAEKQ